MHNYSPANRYDSQRFDRGSSELDDATESDRRGGAEVAPSARTACPHVATSDFVEPTKGAPALSRPSPPGSTPPLILIVDDVVDLLEVWQRLLEGSGFRAVTVSNGIAGLERAKRSESSVIIADYMRQGMDGLTLCRKLRSDPKLVSATP